MKIRPSTFAFTVLLASLAALPPLATDMMLTALPVIGGALRASATTAGYAISFFFIGFAAAQLIFGPCSDRFGRRPVGIAGCALFAVAGFGCTFAQSISALLAWRVVQGIGAGAGAVLAFAIVRDSFTGAAAQVRFAHVSACMAFAPMAAPTLGAGLYTVAGWRAIFALLGVAGLALVAALSFGFEESLAPSNRISLHPSALARNYARVLSHPAVLTYSLVATFTFGAMMSYVTMSPFVFIERLGLTRAQFGFMFFLTASGIMTGSALSGWLLHRFAVRGEAILKTSLALSVTATLTLTALAYAHLFTPPRAIPLLMLATLASGLSLPTVTHGVLAPMGERAGTAAAVLGCLRMLGGAAASALVSGAGASTPLGMSTAMCAFSLLALATYFAMR